MSKTSKRILSMTAAVITVLGFAAGVTFAQTTTPTPTSTTTPTPTMAQDVQGATVPEGAPSTGKAL